MSDARPTPGKRDPEGRRRAILSAAAEIIVNEGPAALTHRAVAARAGVALGSTTQYFASIDELREAALTQLAQEIDESLAEIEPHFADIVTHPRRAAAEVLAYLADTRAVNADIALIASGTTDARLRELARRWNDRLIEMLEPHVGLENARALAVYLDGATVHSALNISPLSEDEIAAAFSALSGYRSSTGTTATAERPELRRTSGPAH